MARPIEFLEFKAIEAEITDILILINKEDENGRAALYDSERLEKIKRLAALRKELHCRRDEMI